MPVGFVRRNAGCWHGEVSSKWRRRCGPAVAPFSAERCIRRRLALEEWRRLSKLPMIGVETMCDATRDRPLCWLGAARCRCAWPARQGPLPACRLPWC